MLHNWVFIPRTECHWNSSCHLVDRCRRRRVLLGVRADRGRGLAEVDEMLAEDRLQAEAFATGTQSAEDQEEKSVFAHQVQPLRR